MTKEEKSTGGEAKLSNPAAQRKKSAGKKPVKKTVKKQKKKPEYRDIGIDVSPPKKTCNDPNCPFHGTLPVRGQIFEGKVERNRMEGTAVIEVERLHYVKKFERYERRYKKFSAHVPPCMDLNVGDEVKIMECRPLSKTVSFVVVEVKE